jgi:hypothetical protein
MGVNSLLQMTRASEERLAGIGECKKYLALKLLEMQDQGVSKAEMRGVLSRIDLTSRELECEIIMRRQSVKLWNEKCSRYNLSL